MHLRCATIRYKFFNVQTLSFSTPAAYFVKITENQNNILLLSLSTSTLSLTSDHPRRCVFCPTPCVGALIVLSPFFPPIFVPGQQCCTLPPAVATPHICVFPVVV